MKRNCPYAKKCGGCRYISEDYNQELRKKQAEVSRLLASFCKVEPIIGMKDPLHYRNKVHGVVAGDRKGNCYTGIYAEKSHRVIRVDHCLIENEQADRIMNTVTGLMKSFKMQPYDEDSRKGFLRHILIRTGHVTGQILLVLVTSTNVFPGKNNFIKALRKEHPEITSIVTNINKRKTSMILGDRQQVLYGKGFIEDRLCGKTFRISPRSFYQVNPVQTEILYGKAIEYAGLTGKEKVIDAYCGIGTIGMAAADHCARVTGVELNGDAVRDALANAKRNKTRNIRFICADAGEYMVKEAERKNRADVVFMDPPRAGSDRRFLSCLVRMAPEKIVYISCNPETLKRDLSYLTGQGYRVEQIQPVDMFPGTGHVETVVLLRGEKVDGHVEIDLDVDKPGRKSGTATYAEIKAYIEEKYGFKVSTLYIAQIKDKVGLEKRKNYNPGEGKSKVPICTPEKEEAIMDAFRHFNLI